MRRMRPHPLSPRPVCRGMAVVWDCVKRPFAVSWTAARAGSCSRGNGEPARWCPASGAAAGPRCRHPDAHTVNHHKPQTQLQTKSPQDHPLRGLFSSSSHQSQTCTSARSTNRLKSIITGCQRARRCQQRLDRYRQHIVTMPYLPPVRRRPCTTVAARMAPVAPRVTLERSRRLSVHLWRGPARGPCCPGPSAQPATEQRTLLFSSTQSMSEAFRPTYSRALGWLLIGPIPMISGGTPLHGESHELGQRRQTVLHASFRKPGSGSASAVRPRTSYRP